MGLGAARNWLLAVGLLAVATAYGCGPRGVATLFPEATQVRLFASPGDPISVDSQGHVAASRLLSDYKDVPVKPLGGEFLSSAEIKALRGAVR